MGYTEFLKYKFKVFELSKHLWMEDMVGQIVLCMVILFSSCCVRVNLPQFDWLYAILKLLTAESLMLAQRKCVPLDTVHCTIYSCWVVPAVILCWSNAAHVSCPLSGFQQSYLGEAKWTCGIRGYVICGFNCVIGGTVVQERVHFSNQAKLYSNACLKTMWGWIKPVCLFSSNLPQ